MPNVTNEQLDALQAVLEAARSGSAHTKPGLMARTGLGRAVVAQRVAQLTELGLMVEGAHAPSTGGRAAREVHFHAGAGYILGAVLGATSVMVGLTDLAGRVLATEEEALDIAGGPDACLSRVEELFDALLSADSPATGELWGIGIGIPGPVEFASGLPIAPPIMPGWDGYPVRRRFMDRYRVPVWVDNEVNTMALGELRGGRAVGETHVLYVKLGTGIGSGLISNGQLHRGAQGCAGDLGHVAVAEDGEIVCRCGNRGCLEALAGGTALARAGVAAAGEGQSDYLAKILSEQGEITARDIADAARQGDPAGHRILREAGHLIGGVLATVVSILNPSLILIGGGLTNAGDLLLASIREATYRRSLPLATRDLRLTFAPDGDRAGITGAAFMAIDELFSPPLLARWISNGSPIGLADDLLPG